MKHYFLGIVAGAGLLGLAACDKHEAETPPPTNPKLTSAQDLPAPANTAPPIDAEPYEKGYEAGLDAGEAAARALPRRGPKKEKIELPADLSGLALEAAGKDLARGPRWQRGFASGYKDGFESVAEGKK